MTRNRIIISTLVILSVLLAGYFAMQKSKKNHEFFANDSAKETPEIIVDTETASSTKIPESVINAVEKKPQAKDIPSQKDINTNPSLYMKNLNDQDNDGLTDEMELKFKTNKDKADSDDDGVSDFQETMSYFTDPNSKDTDNDGHSDGDEIKNRFNPCGDGNLPAILELAKQCSSLKK